MWTRKKEKINSKIWLIPNSLTSSWNIDCSAQDNAEGKDRVPYIILSLRILEASV